VAAVPSIGRATRVVETAAPEADATRALYEQYANQIFRYCLHQLGSREEAEDAVQSTFLNAFRGLKRGVVPELESAWLFKIAHNVCLSRRRSSWRRGRVESPHDFELVEEFAPAPTRQGEELIGLQDVLEGMPENQRRAILLREWQGLSYREIAEELEVSQAAVETLIFRARRSLAQGLEQAPVEQRSWRARLRSALDLGGAVGAVQGWLAGGAAVKVTAAVVAVTATTVVASTPAGHHLRHAHHGTPTAPAVAHHASSGSGARVSAGVPLTAAAAARDVHSAVHRAATIQTLARRKHPHEAVSGSSAPVSASAPAASDTTQVSTAPPTDTTPPAPPAAPPAQQAAPSPAAGSHPSPPAVPPGQAKKDDASSAPPGQAKKDDPAPQPAANPPTQDQGSHDNKGQDKKDQQAPPVAPAPQPSDPTPPQAGRNSDAPGQVRKNAVVLAPAPPAPPVVAPVQPVTPDPTAVQPTQPPQSPGPGGDNGHGNGHGSGGDNGHGQGRHP
jgi:RNA polymerase sigma factor (sigma-70 family)